VGPLSVTPSWTTISVPFTPTASTSSCYLIFYSLANHPCSFSVDNVSIRKDSP
jgi:hypothetical protein